MADREKSIKSKIVPGKDLGNPKAIAVLPETVRHLLMGTVMGRVEKLIQRTMPTGETYEGLSGYFEAIPANPELPVVQSGVCYLPAGFFELVAGPLTEAKKANPEATLDFVFEVAVVRDGNPQGYSWQYTPKMAQTSADPLAHLRVVLAPAAAQIENKPQTVSDAPVKEKATAKK